MTVSSDEFRVGMRQLAAAVSVITTVRSGLRAGMTATAVMSLTADPPQLGIAVNRSNASYASIAGSMVFAVNVLRHDQAKLANRFAGADGVKGEERFLEGAWETLSTGAPILSDGAAAYDCRVDRMVDLGSHVLFVGHVEAIRTVPSVTPLLFMDGTWASLVRTRDHDFLAYEDVIRQIEASTGVAISNEASPSEQLRSFSTDFARITADSVEILRDFFSRELVVPAQRLDEINQRKRDVEEKLLDILRMGVLSGDFDLSDPELAAGAIIGMMNSIHRWPWERRTSQSASIGEQFGSLVSAMVARRPASNAPPSGMGELT